MANEKNLKPVRTKKEARERGFKEIYLKTTLNDYYEKFGATFVKKISDKEKIYKFELQKGNIL